MIGSLTRHTRSDGSRTGEDWKSTTATAKKRPGLTVLVLVLVLAASDARTARHDTGSRPGTAQGAGPPHRADDQPSARGESPAAAPLATYRGKTAVQWAEVLSDKDYWVRWHATYALGRMGPDAAPAVTALERILANREEHEYVRGGAAWALGRIGPPAASAVPLLVQTLSSNHVSVRRNTATALGCIASPNSLIKKDTTHSIASHLTADAISRLVKLLGDEEPTVRSAAAEALWRIERHPKALATLETMLRNPNGSIACGAASVLGELAANEAPVALILVAALGHADADTRRTAAQAFGRVGPAAVPSLQNALATADEQTKIQAVEALGWIGPPAATALTGALGHADPLVRRHAARALGRLGPAAKVAEPALVRAVSDSDSGVREAAAVALRRVRGD
jgi:HEAT repeat protein